MFQVHCRIRPLSKEEKERKENSCIEMNDDSSISLTPPKSSLNFRVNGETQTQFYFSSILGPECNQEETFVKTMLPLTQSFLQGGNALAFAYGITNAGKTFTITGTKEEPGLVPRLLDVLFNSIKGATNQVPIHSFFSQSEIAGTALQAVSKEKVHTGFRI